MTPDASEFADERAIFQKEKKRTKPRLANSHTHNARSSQGGRARCRLSLVPVRLGARAQAGRAQGKRTPIATARTAAQTATRAGVHDAQLSVFVSLLTRDSCVERVATKSIRSVISCVA